MKKIDIKTITSISNLFKVISDPTRIKILYVLKDTKLNVTTISELIGVTQSAVSHQLRVLRVANLVTKDKKGKEVIYSLYDKHVYDIFETAIIHVNEEKN
ncbi:ArsR/SmtB family transcription factor [Haploplasma axanthum]|uniref:HTH-type transcriptional repressor CzrA n=1 Tax=Haploplasma axanthum TaxID=29552 RepID=A0A449BFU2_HAPAX|nr:metalloregulator ArsR/SmtB family transcription factor [Haploplasma axanthum]VEU81296.1 HTH-type transcriptional repressor CzrA [Haploplasma axanthum]